MVTDAQRKAVFLAKLKGETYHHGPGSARLNGRSRLASELIDLGVLERHRRHLDLFAVIVPFELSSPYEAYDAGVYVGFANHWFTGPTFKVQTFTRRMPPK